MHEWIVVTAAGLGFAAPEAMPKALLNPAAPEFTTSATLSLTALPSDGSIRSRSVAILVADGVSGSSVAHVQNAVLAAGAKVHLVAQHLGPVRCSNGAPFDATGTFENAPSVLFDGLVLPDGTECVQALGRCFEVMDFIANQYRHGKTILALGAATALLAQAGASMKLKSGDADPGIVLGAAAKADHAVKEFIAALGQHRHPEREAG